MISRLWARYSNSVSLIFFAGVLLLSCVDHAYGQAAPCPDPAPQTAGTHRFRHAGDSFNIPVTVGDCQSVALDLRWSNGSNNGSNFIVTFFDHDNQPIYSKQLWGFMTGNQQFPFLTLETQPWLGSASMIAVPATVTIQAIQPFAFPSSISYRVIRASRHPKPKLSVLDDKLVMSLRSAPGRLLTEGQTSASLKYKLEELKLAEPRELELHGRKVTIENAYRPTIKGGEFSNSGLIWLDDAALPAFWSDIRQDIATLIFDVSILRDGAEIAFSTLEGEHRYSLSEHLKLPAGLVSSRQTATEEGNAITRIHNAVRLIGASRQPLVLIELGTNRPFPPKDTPLQLQVGRRFFLNELSGDHTGRTLTLALTPEMFAEIKDGVEIVAFFNKPDRSGAAGQDLWYFGRLNKSLLDK